VAKAADQLCMTTGDLLLPRDTQLLLTEVEREDRRSIVCSDGERCLLNTCELADFVRGIILDNEYSLLQGTDFPSENAFFLESDENRAVLGRFLPSTYHKNPSAGVWELRAGHFSNPQWELRTFYENVSAQEMHPKAVAMWTSHLLASRPAAVAESAPDVAEGYAVVVDDVTGSVATGLLLAGFRKVMLVLTPDCVQQLPDHSDCQRGEGDKRGPGRLQSFNWETVVAGRERIIRTVANSFISHNYTLSKGPFAHIWNDANRPDLPAPPKLKEIPARPHGIPHSDRVNSGIMSMQQP
jgi:hypothetical protein